MKQSFFFFTGQLLQKCYVAMQKNGFTDYTVIFSYWIPYSKLWINTEQKLSSWLWKFLQILVVTAAGMC